MNNRRHGQVFAGQLAGVCCPSCGRDDTETLETRKVTGATRRRRQCQCGVRFTTMEKAIYSKPNAISRRAKALRSEGFLLKEIAHRLKVSITTVHNALNQ